MHATLSTAVTTSAYLSDNDISAVYYTINNVCEVQVQNAANQICYTDFKRFLKPSYCPASSFLLVFYVSAILFKLNENFNSVDGCCIC